MERLPCGLGLTRIYFCSPLMKTSHCLGLVVVCMLIRVLVPGRRGAVSIGLDHSA